MKLDSRQMDFLKILREMIKNQEMNDEEVYEVLEYLFTTYKIKLGKVNYE